MALELAFLPLLFFLPGYFMANLLFPRQGSLGGDLDLLYRLFMGVLLSVVITIVYGGALVITGTATGQVLFLPGNLWPGLIVITLVLFFGGLFRGGYPRVRRLFGLSIPEPVLREMPDTQAFDRLTMLAEQLEALKLELAARKGSKKEVQSLERQVRELEAEMRGLEEEARREA